MCVPQCPMAGVLALYKQHVLNAVTPAAAAGLGRAPAAAVLPSIAGMPAGGGKAGAVNWKLSILSGGLAGGIEIMITYPTEFVKTQLQLDYKRSPRKFAGSFDVVKQTVAEKGPFGVYRGLSSLIAGSVPKAAVRFWAYEQARKQLMDEKGALTRMQQLSCGLLAGMAEAIFAVCPMESVKVKMIHDQNQPKPRYKGLVHGIATIVREDGPKALFQGLSATIMKQGSNQAIRFFVMHEWKSYWLGHEHASTGRLSVPLSLAGGVVAGAASVIGNNPLDVIKTNMQGLQAKQYKNTWDCARQIYAANGFMGFYKGCGPRFARVCGDVAIVFTLYDQITHALKGVKFLNS